MSATTARAVSVKLGTDMHERIKRLADAKRRTPHWMMREAITQYVDREERRASFYQDAMDAWHEYERTGLHLNAQEVDDWLSKLEAGNDIDPPPCHR
ncbi:MAG: ribbon-helix-helix protein, CopG family [Lautropia sp.]|nr:ribbon-helix-helix protein, CopG family [Lautropia sp.]